VHFCLSFYYSFILVVTLHYHFIHALAEYQPQVYSTLLFHPCYSNLLLRMSCLQSPTTMVKMSCLQSPATMLLALGYRKPPLFISVLRLLRGNSYLWHVCVIIYEWPMTNHIRCICHVVKATTPRWMFEGGMREAT
jgi:hypothetical protein